MRLTLTIAALLTFCASLAIQTQAQAQTRANERTNEAFAQANAIHHKTYRLALHSFGHLGLEFPIGAKTSLAVLGTGGPKLDARFRDDSEDWEVTVDDWRFRTALELRYHPFTGRGERYNAMTGPFIGPYAGFHWVVDGDNSPSEQSTTLSLNSAAGVVVGYQIITQGGFVVSGLTGLGSRATNSGDAETDFRLGFSLGVAL